MSSVTLESSGTTYPSSFPIPSENAESDQFIPTFASLEPISSSHFKRVFKTNENLRNEFFTIYKEIFCDFDEKKLLALLQELLDDDSKSDQEIYENLRTQISSTEFRGLNYGKIRLIFRSFLFFPNYMRETAKDFQSNHFQNYLEVDSCHLINIIKKSGLALKGRITTLCDQIPQGIFACLKKTGSFFFPYTTVLPCTQEAIQTIEDASQDVVVYEHYHSVMLDNNQDIVSENPFSPLQPIISKLRPGGIIFLKFHDHEKLIHRYFERMSFKPSTEDISSLFTASILLSHAEANSEWEETEITYISSQEHKSYLSKLGLTLLAENPLNIHPSTFYRWAYSHVALKTPTTLNELRRTLSDRTDYFRSKVDCTSAFLTEGLKRSEADYAHHLQHKHAYSFNYIGHLRQHYTNFYHFVKECLNDKDVSKRDLIFSGGMAMNLFLLAVATLHSSLSTLKSIPEACYAKWQYGEKWRDIAHLSELEKFQAEESYKYTTFSHQNPFYHYDFVQTIKQMWNVMMRSEESAKIKIVSYISAAFSTVALLAKAGISLPLKFLPHSEVVPDTVKVVVKDKTHQLPDFITAWNIQNPHHKIDVLIQTTDAQYQTLIVPNHQPFINFCNGLLSLTSAKIIEVCGQKELYVEVLSQNPYGLIPKVKVMKLLDATIMTNYTTYKIQAKSLKVLSDLFKDQILRIF